MNLPDILAAFHREGYVLLPGLLPPDVVQKLRALADHHLDSPSQQTREVESVYGAAVLRNTQSLDPFFSEFLVRDPFGAINEALLGKDFGFCGQNVIRTGKDEGISLWHVDDALEFPLPPEIPRHDPRITLPVVWYSMQIALSDITSPDDGPTQIVPRSHYSGRPPPIRETQNETLPPPVFEGHGPIPILCKAGDIYLFNHQLWHRGSPNRSGKIRYLMQNQYSRRWVDRRFGPGPHRDCSLSPAAIATLSPAARKLLRV